jgi:hypothetical protein
MPQIHLPSDSGSLQAFEWPETKACPQPTSHFNRTVYAAAHVATHTLRNGQIAIDWDSTLAFRQHIWSYGLGVAEAMDTAQRGMGLNWTMAKELMARSADLSAQIPGALMAAGCGTDQLSPTGTYSLQQIIDAYMGQLEWLAKLGIRPIIMASRALAAAATHADHYLTVYGEVLSQVHQPAILHWLGEMFDPALAGYWGSRDHYQAMETVGELMQGHANQIDGIKLSLLDTQKELLLRGRLLPQHKLYTGDDYHYPELICGDEQGYSHALLGIFSAIAPQASWALQQLTCGKKAQFMEILAPTLPLARHIFAPPTQYYKTGIAFLAWLNGFQPSFTMLQGLEQQRNPTHLVELFKLAANAGSLYNIELAASRMGTWLTQVKWT